MWSRRITRLVSFMLGVTLPLAVGNAMAQGEAPPSSSPTTPDVPGIVLYDQINNPGTNAITSQNFESDLDAFDGRAADDFVVTSGVFWTITSVEISGKYEGASAIVNSVNVQFYRDAGTGLPGELEYSATLVPSGGLNDGNFVIDLSPPAYLAPGGLWLSIQANMDFAGANVWQWEERTVQSRSAAAYQNPGGGSAPACVTWGRLWDVCFSPGEGHAPDLLFRLSGTEGPAIQAYLPLISR